MENTILNYKNAIINSMDFLGKDPSIIFVGYNIKKESAANDTLKNIDSNKLFETPVAENLMLSMAIGLSIENYIPVVFFERFDFILNAMDALVNHLDKIKIISQGEYNPKVIIRIVVGGRKKPFFTGLTHIQDFTENIKSFVSFPVYKLPLSYTGICDIYKNALISNESTIIIEEKDLYDEQV